MVHTGAILHGDVLRHLRFDPAEHPVALQLGGSEPGELARAARIGHELGYDEINLNCGCPSDRVQRGRFGACLMAEPARVAECVAAMRAAVPVPVTVKCRIGIDASEEYGFLATFVATVAAAGCRHVHRARPQGLAEGPEPQGEPRDPAAAPRGRHAPEARVPRARDGAQWRPPLGRGARSEQLAQSTA